MFQLFQKGGPVMWPLLAASFFGMSVVIERFFFILRQTLASQPQLREKILIAVETGQLQEVLPEAQRSKDPVVRMLMEGIRQKEALQTALVSKAAEELKKYSSGISVLDTIITLAPLLGLLGTVTGMIHAFGLLGAAELEAPAAITGGIAEALIATAFGLGIAIGCLIPFNWLNTCLENMKHDMEQAGSLLETILAKLEKEERREKDIYETSRDLR